MSVPNVPMIPMIDEERKKEKGMARIVKGIYRRTNTPP